MAFILSWSSCQADYYSSDDDEYDDKVEDEENLEEVEESDDSEEEFDIELSEIEQTNKHDDEVVKRKISRRKALDILKENEGDVQKTAEIIVDMLLHSDKELSSQGNRKKEHEVLLIKAKLFHLSKADKNRKFRHKSGQQKLDETFENLSQSSLLDMFKGDSQSTPDKAQSQDDLVDTGEKNKITNAVRKPLNKCKDTKTMKVKTDLILGNVVAEAQSLMVTPTALMAYLMYRLNYNSRRDFATSMFKVFKEDEWFTESVGLEKALALVERRRLGKSGYRYLKKHLSPHGVKLPSYTDVSTLRSTLVSPTLMAYYSHSGQAIGVTTNFPSSLQATLRRMIQAGLADFLSAANCSLVASVTVGFDGRGGEKEYAQRSQIKITSTHSLSCLYTMSDVRRLPSETSECIDRHRDPGHRAGDCIVGRGGWVLGEGGVLVRDSWRCGGDQGEDQATGHPEDSQPVIKKPLNYQETGDMIWNEHQLMSPWAARPLGLVMMRETRQNTIDFVKNFLEPQVKSLTHFGSSAHTKETNSWQLYSARGQTTVDKDSCTIKKIEGRIEVKVPMRHGKTKSDGAEDMDVDDVVVNKEGTVEVPRVIELLQSTTTDDTKRRFLAFKWMLSRGHLKGASLDAGNNLHTSSVLKKFNALIKET